MATKLTTSLRNSVIAEKKSLADKKIAGADKRNDAPVAKKSPAIKVTKLEAATIATDPLVDVKTNQPSLGLPSNPFLVNLQMVRSNVEDYYKRLASSKDFADLCTANLEFFVQLRTQQLEFWKKQVPFFASYRAI